MFSIGKLISCKECFAKKSKKYFVNYAEYYDGDTLLSPSKGYIQAIMHQNVEIILTKYPALKIHKGFGMYTGSTGVAFMLYRVGTTKMFQNHRAAFLKHSLSYITPALDHFKEQKEDKSFLQGYAGTCAVAAAIYRALGDNPNANDHLQEFISLYDSYLPVHFSPHGSDDFFIGRTGYLAGVLWIEKELQVKVLPKKIIYQLCEAVIISGRELSKKHNLECPLMYEYYGIRYLGAGHGLSFILQTLLSIPGYLKSNQSAKTDIRKSVEYLLSLQSESGNFPCALDNKGRPNTDTELVHWCHGAPGIAYLMAKAYMVYKERKYLISCLKCGELVWKKGLLKKGAGICHGIAGSAYVFLLLYRLTNDRTHLHRATVFANFMQSKEFQKGARVPDHPYSLYEGSSGTVCFLFDLLYPNHASFPFQDPFIEI